MLVTVSGTTAVVINEQFSNARLEIILTGILPIYEGILILDELPIYLFMVIVLEPV